MIGFDIKHPFTIPVTILLSFISTGLSAQRAPDLNPQNNTLQDTAHEMDLIDVYKKWFKLPLKSKTPPPENKIYFTLDPLASMPTSSGNALVTSTTANIYLGPKSTTFLSSVNFAPYFGFNGRYGLPLRSFIWLRIMRGTYREISVSWFTPNTPGV